MKFYFIIVHIALLADSILLMLILPGDVVQKKTQAEIDAFTDRMNRCPNTNEKDQFPSVITELYRW